MIQFKNVSKNFSDNVITFKDYEFENGKSYLILGPSGSGKSTLLNIIAGITQCSSGQLIINNNDVTHISQSQKDKIRTKDIGYIYQDFKLIDDLTVEDNIKLLEICKIPSENFNQIVKELEIQDKLKRKVRTLSGGEKQRVAIARALVKNPKIILADEPTGSLNYEIGLKIIKKLLECAKNKILIVVTHDTRLEKYFDVVIDIRKEIDND